MGRPGRPERLSLISTAYAAVAEVRIARVATSRAPCIVVHVHCIHRTGSLRIVRCLRVGPVAADVRVSPWKPVSARPISHFSPRPPTPVCFRAQVQLYIVRSHYGKPPAEVVVQRAASNSPTRILKSHHRTPSMDVPKAAEGMTGYRTSNWLIHQVGACSGVASCVEATKLRPEQLGGTWVHVAGAPLLTVWHSQGLPLLLSWPTT